MAPTGKAFSDLTGRFPHRSSWGNEYILVVYHYDSNAILVEPVKNRQAATLTEAWKKLNKKLKQRGEQPVLYILDNEFLQDLRTAFFKTKVAFQLAPPHMYRCNAAERAIRTFKNHFLAGLASCDPRFSLGEWDRLIAQAELTLNLIRPARLNPKFSAHAYLSGPFDFNKSPLDPPGTRVVVHDRPENRPSWGFHGTDGWYVDPATDHVSFSENRGSSSASGRRHRSYPPQPAQKSSVPRSR